MTTDLKSEIRARMQATGEKYTTARRHLLAERAERSPSSPTRVTIHTTQNGLHLGDDDCGATTRAGRQCRNPYVPGQFWPGGHHEVLLTDSPEARMLAQQRCHVHVDHTRPVEIVLVMDDVSPMPHSAPFTAPIWQDPRSLALIRSATVDAARAETLSLYMTLGEAMDRETLSVIAEHAGLTKEKVEAGIELLTSLELMRDGVLVA